MPTPSTPCLFGPTASGKSDVAVHLARATDGEVIACDAFSVYRGMAVLTAAPEAPPDVPHHLVGHLEPDEAWSAARFTAATDTLVEAIRARGRTPWVVGGTALYLRSFLKGFGAPVPRDAAYRATLEAEAEAEGREALHARLAALDPERAAELHPNDRTRVIRALEIIRATGRPASTLRDEWKGPDRRPTVVVGLRRETDDLDQRIRARVDEMFAAGVEEEVRLLTGRPLSREASMALGLDTIRQLLEGTVDEDAARETIAQRTRRLARKQMTFFRSFPDTIWIDVLADEPGDAVASRILRSLPDQVRGMSS